jgi:opacity protein-like surface antigen
MKQFIALLLVGCLIGTQLQAQMPQNTQDMKKAQKSMRPKIGLKAGYNYAYLYGSTPDFSKGSQNGFMAAIFFSPHTHGGLGYRTELIFSRQGFSFDSSGQVQHVRQDYIFMPHLTTFTIAKVLQLQAGAQIGYLINANKKAPTSSGGNSQETDVTDFMNRFAYGAAVGVEISPVQAVIIGARYNINLGKLYKDELPTTGGPTPMPVPFPFPVNPADFKGKNAVVQFFIGVRL